MVKHHMAWAASIAAIAFVLSACAQGDKAGGDAIVLHLATIDGEVNGSGAMIAAEAFVEALEEVSGGRIVADVELGYGEGAPDGETRLVEAIASGEIDGGWPAARAFSGAGITSLQPLEAPLVLESAASLGALVQGEAPRFAAEALDGSGLHSVGLASAALRRPFAGADPLVSLDDWSGAKFRVFSSPLQEATVRALGGEPVPAGFDWVDLVAAGELDGGDFDLAGYYANGYRDRAGRVAANVALWPKIMVLALSEERWGTLSAQQREWVTEAADVAVDAALAADFAAAEVDAAAALCGRGVIFDEATDEQLAELRGAVAGIIDDLGAADSTSALMAAVLAAGREQPDPDAPVVTTDCTGDTGTVATEPAPIPDGIYRAEITMEDAANAGLPNATGNSGIWTLTLTGGEYALMCRPMDDPGIDCGHFEYTGADSYDTVLEAGYIRGDDTRAWIVYDPAVHDRFAGCGECFPASTVAVEWQLDEGALILTDPTGDTTVQWVVKPWEKIG